MLGLAGRLLEAAKRGPMRRGREVHQFDLGYTGSLLALEGTGRAGGRMPGDRPAGVRLAGDRAPDAPVRGAGGQPSRLFELFRGPHWTLLGYEADRDEAVAPRLNLRIHTVGPRGDLIDDGGHLRDGYGVVAGD